MFNTGVDPVLNYGCGIWGYSKANDSDLIHNRAIRYFLGVHKFTPIPALYGEMGWAPAHVKKKMCMLRFWNRMSGMSSDRLTKRIFNVDFTSEYGWCSETKKIFNTIEMKSSFDNKVKCDLNLAEEKLLLNAQDDWKANVQQKPKLRTYVKYKTSYGTADYVKFLLNKSDRSIMAKFRCGILQLHIETGRFSQTKLEDRTCIICKDGNIEDEFHFLCICNEYSDERKIMYLSAQNKVKNTEKIR